VAKYLLGFGLLGGAMPPRYGVRMTGELLLVAVVVGLLGGWLVGIVKGKGVYGFLGDLSLGLVGGTIAVWIYQAVGLVKYAGVIGAMVAVFMGAASVALAQRSLRYLRA
jgi:uncharacterized membrane protein YeaQ/YmgE (transglycosylase-associated protein family)